MDQATIYEQLTQIVRDVFDDDSLQATPELAAADVDGWDSVTHIRFLLTVERFFHIKFSTAEIAKLERIGDLVALIQARV
jgi:acyl carrier protein